MFSVNWKSRTTWTAIGAAITAVGCAAFEVGDVTWAAAGAAVFAALGTIFMRDAVKPAAAAALCFVLVGCSTLPATQNAKESAGRSKVHQESQVWQNDYRSFLPKQMKVEGDFNLTIYANGNERSSDVAQTNSGSTTATQAATATQSPTNTTTTETPVNVSGLPGQ